MRKLFLASALAVFLAGPSVAFAGELKLSIDGGLVTLVAKDVPLSTLLSEWARVGRTTIVNGDKIFTPVTLQLEAVPERRALEIVLRSAAGYMVAERSTPLAGASAFDRIMILPTSRPPATQPVFQQATPPPFAPRPAMPMPMPVPDDDHDQPPTQNQQPAVPALPGQPGQQPQGPLTSPRPGQLPQPAPQQPVPFGAPRPPGGGGPGGPPTGPGGPGGVDR